MKLDISKLEESAWVEYRDGMEILVRPLPASKRDEFERQAAVYRVDKIRNVRIKEIDELKQEELLRDYMIEDWRGIVDQNDNPIPCTKENKLLILDHLHELRGFVLKAALDLQGMIELQKAENEKNSGKTC